MGVWSQKGKYNNRSSLHKWEALKGTCEQFSVDYQNRDMEI